MNERYQSLRQRLKEVSYLITHLNEPTEAKLGELNAHLHLLSQSGLLAEAVILGAIIHQRNYPPRPGGHSSVLYFHAALVARRGVGTILWDSEEYFAAEAEDALETLAPASFVAFHDCEPIVKVLLLPHVETLLEGVIERLANVERQTKSPPPAEPDE